MGGALGKNVWTRYGVRIMYPGYGTFGRFLLLGEYGVAMGTVHIVSGQINC